MSNKLHPINVELVVRGLRSFYLRNLDRYARKPKMSERIVSHIADFDQTGSLVEQLDFLAEREVKTFRIYTDRARDLALTLASHDRLSRLSIAIIPIDGVQKWQHVWKRIDNFDFALPSDRWSLALRAGEFLLYPHFETRALPDLCQFLFDENRRSLFAVTLDLYPGPAAAAAGLAIGCEGWACDRYGYSCETENYHQVQRWYGGFLYRYPDHLRAYGRAHLSRVPLVRAGNRARHSKDLTLALPRRLNHANSLHHLSPTGCIVSDHAYRFWMSRIPKSALDRATVKLVSAARLDMRWRHRDLVSAGFMNMGQWL